MNFLEYLGDQWGDLVELGVDHVVIVGIAVLIDTVVGVALGIATYRSARASELVIAVTGTFLTIPSLALFPLFIVLGLGLGFTPVLLGLILYGLLPIVRNTIVGLREVDPAVVESAQGMGMGRNRRLLQIELPLAWPVVLTGLRVSTLIIIGIAAIGAFVNGPGLGNDIFTGLARIGTPNAVNLVLGGMLGIVVLAIMFDSFYILVTRLTTSRGLR